MANSKQAIKRARQNSNRYKLRHAQRSVVRTAVKAVRADIDSKDKAKASESFKKAQKVIDTAASKNVIHRNAFLCITFFEAAVSITFCAFLKDSEAFALSLESISALTAFTAVLTTERCACLSLYLLEFCLALLIACFELAII